MINKVSLEGVIKSLHIKIEDENVILSMYIHNECTKEDSKETYLNEIPLKLTCTTGTWYFIKHLFNIGVKICLEGTLQIDHSSEKMYVLINNLVWNKE